MADDERTDKYDHQPFDKAYLKSNDVEDGDPSKDDRGLEKQRVVSFELQHELARLETRDDKLKKWIRILKFASRTLGVILALATIIPLAMMAQKHSSTRNTLMNVDGTMRTAWPTNTTTVYSDVYLAFSIISFVLNIIILLAYFRGIQHANQVAMINAWWTGIILAAHIIVMITGVAVFHTGSKQMNSNGEHRDLWGWTCSPAAQNIQPWVTDMKYSEWCASQTMSYYVGISNTAAAALTLTIYVFAFARKKSKKKVQTVPRLQFYDGAEPINNVTWAPVDRKQSNLRNQCTWSSFDGKEPEMNNCTWAPLDDKLRDSPA